MTSTCAPLSALAGSSPKVAPEDDHLRHARTADVGLKGARTARRDKLSNCGALMRFFFVDVCTAILLEREDRDDPLRSRKSVFSLMPLARSWLFGLGPRGRISDVLLLSPALRLDW